MRVVYPSIFFYLRFKWNLLISCRHVTRWKLGKERAHNRLGDDTVSTASLRKHNFLTMSQGSSSSKLVCSKAWPSADSLCDSVSTSRQMGLEVVPQHTGFAFGHLVPQQKRGSAGNTGKHVLRFRQKLVLRLAAVVTSPVTYKSWEGARLPSLAV